MRLLSSNALHIAAIAALALVVSVALAQGAEMHVTGAWIRALPANLPAGGYFTLHNVGPKTLSLTGASSPACGMLMLHESENVGGMMHMKDVAKVDVPAGGSVAFAPGGYHLMCMKPTAAVRPGNKVDVTLDFSDGSSASAPFEVRSASGR